MIISVSYEDGVNETSGYRIEEMKGGYHIKVDRQFRQQTGVVPLLQRALHEIFVRERRIVNGH